MLKTYKKRDPFPRVSFSSGGRTRTSDLWVMSPTSCQLLHPAICSAKIIKKTIKQKFFWLQKSKMSTLHADFRTENVG